VTPRCATSCRCSTRRLQALQLHPRARGRERNCS